VTKSTRPATRSGDTEGSPDGGPGESATPEESPARRLHDRALAAVGEFFDAARQRNQAPETLSDAAARLAAVAAEIVDRVRDSEAMIVLTMDPYPSGQAAVIPHSVNVAIMGVRVSVGAGLSGERALTICRAGLTHDVGAVELADDLLEPVALEPGEGQALEATPARSREILEELGPPFDRAARVAHQVYERLDGSGLPLGLTGDDILVESRVLGAVHFLDAAVHTGPSGGHDAAEAESLGVQRLVKMSRSFGEDVLKGVVRGIGLFPAGTLVRLSSGEVAQVQENRPDNPMRPRVEVLDVAGGPASGRSRTIDLVRTPHVYVSGAVSASDLDELDGARERRSSRRTRRPGKR